jgi:hypothetical protein
MAAAHCTECFMITLYSYPGLYGLEDNNPYGQKVFAFLRLCRLPFEHHHILDAKAAPRAQLPYLVDEATTIGDSRSTTRSRIRSAISICSSAARSTICTG